MRKKTSKIRGESSDKSCRLEMPVCASAQGKTCCNAAADQLILINATTGLRPAGGLVCQGAEIIKVNLREK